MQSSVSHIRGNLPINLKLSVPKANRRQDVYINEDHDSLVSAPDDDGNVNIVYGAVRKNQDEWPTLNEGRQ